MFRLLGVTATESLVPSSCEHGRTRRGCTFVSHHYMDFSENYGMQCELVSTSEQEDTFRINWIKMHGWDDM